MRHLSLFLHFLSKHTFSHPCWGHRNTPCCVLVPFLFFRILCPLSCPAPVLVETNMVKRSLIIKGRLTPSICYITHTLLTASSISYTKCLLSQIRSYRVSSLIKTITGESIEFLPGAIFYLRVCAHGLETDRKISDQIGRGTHTIVRWRWKKRRILP